MYSQTVHSALRMMVNWGDSRTQNIKYLLLFHGNSGNANAPQCLFCSMLRSIAVHIHSVFCVPCTVCHNVQQCAGTAILKRLLQCSLRCAITSVHVHWGLSIGHVHHQVPHTRVYVYVLTACAVHVYPFCLSLHRDSLCRTQRRQMTRAAVRLTEHSHLTPSNGRQFLKFK